MELPSLSEAVDVWYRAVLDEVSEIYYKSIPHILFLTQLFIDEIKAVLDNLKFAIEFTRQNSINNFIWSLK